MSVLHLDHDRLPNVRLLCRFDGDGSERPFDSKEALCDAYESADKSSWSRHDCLIGWYAQPLELSDDSSSDDTSQSVVIVNKYVAMVYESLPSTSADDVYNEFRATLAFELSVTDCYLNAFERFANAFRAAAWFNISIRFYVGATDAGLSAYVGQPDLMALYYVLFFSHPHAAPDIVRVVYNSQPRVSTVAFLDDLDIDLHLSVSQRYENSLRLSAEQSIRSLHKCIIVEHLKRASVLNSTPLLEFARATALELTYASDWLASKPTRRDVVSTLIQCPIEHVDDVVNALTNIQRNYPISYRSVRVYPLIDRFPAWYAGDPSILWQTGARVRPPYLVNYIVGVCCALHCSTTNYELVETLERLPESRMLGHGRVVALVFAVRNSINAVLAKRDAPYRNTRSKKNKS